MKKFLFLALFSLFVSCSVYQPISNITSKVYIGMPLYQFLQIADGRAQKSAIYETYYVYRINQYEAMYGMLVDSKFYYFRNSDNKLFQVDGGTKNY